MLHFVRTEAVTSSGETRLNNKNAVVWCTFSHMEIVFLLDKLLSILQKLLYLMIILILDFPEESDVFDKSGFDMFIIHELAKNIKLFPQKLVSEVYLEKSRELTK